MLLKSELKAASSIITPQPDSHLPYFADKQFIVIFVRFPSILIGNICGAHEQHLNQ